MPRELNAAEVATFQAAHSELEYSTIPAHGTAVKDGSRYVLVWMDAVWKWRYIDLTGATQLAELTKNNPVFVSPNSSFVDNVWDQINRVGAGAETSLKLLVLAVGLVVVIFVILELQQVRGLTS